MVRYALAGDSMLAMIQPSGEPADATEAANPPIYPVGCVGAITAARKADDGRYYINITGISRFRIVGELPLKDGYRRVRSEEHTSELQSLMRISYAVFCLKKKQKQK